MVLPLVEADRREQLGRAQAAAERRVERRQGLSLGGQLKEKLVAQARALRERIGQQLKLVKEWVREHFPDPIGRLKERSREVFEAVAERAKGMRRPPAQEPERAAERSPAGGQKRGMFDGLRLGSTPAVPADSNAVSRPKNSEQSLQQVRALTAGPSPGARAVDRPIRARLDGRVADARAGPPSARAPKDRAQARRRGAGR